MFINIHNIYNINIVLRVSDVETERISGYILLLKIMKEAYIKLVHKYFVFHFRLVKILFLAAAGIEPKMQERNNARKRHKM